MSVTDSDPDRGTDPDRGAEVAPEPRPSRRPARRGRAEGLPTRLAATAGILGVDVALSAILVGQDVDGWIIGLVLGLVSIAGMAIVWGTQKL
jgi:hypothetical protein